MSKLYDVKQSKLSIFIRAIAALAVAGCMVMLMSGATELIYKFLN